MFAIWTNTSCSFYKYIGQLGQIHFAKNNCIIFYFEYDTKLLLYSSYIKNKILLLWRRNRLYFRQSFSILCEGSKLRNTFLWPSKQAAPREAKMPTPYYLQFLASWRPLSQPSHVILQLFPFLFFSSTHCTTDDKTSILLRNFWMRIGASQLLDCRRQPSWQSIHI